MVRELTPYDTGERCQPSVWVTADPRRPLEHDRDRYGKVDFEDDASEHVATIWIEKIDGEYVVMIDAAQDLAVRPGSSSRTGTEGQDDVTP
jgi:hypothetical protein